MPRVTENDAYSHKNRDEKGGNNRQAASDQFSPITDPAGNAKNTIILDGNEDPEAPIRDAPRAREQKKTSKKHEKITKK